MITLGSSVDVVDWRELQAEPVVEAVPAVESGAQADAAILKLTTEIARGSEDAFQELFDRYHRRIYRLLLVFTRGDETGALDLAQAVLVTAARKLKPVNSEAHLWNWLAKVARQLFIRQWKQSQREARVLAATGWSEVAAEAEADQVLESALDSALNTLEEDEKQLVESFYYSERSCKQIAEQQSTTPKAVASRLERVRQKLRQAVLSRLKHEN